MKNRGRGVLLLTKIPKDFYPVRLGGAKEVCRPSHEAIHVR